MRKVVAKHDAAASEGPTCHLVTIKALVFGWKDKNVLKNEIEDGIGDLTAFYDHEDLEVSVVGDDEPEFPHDIPAGGGRIVPKKPTKKLRTKAKGRGR